MTAPSRPPSLRKRYVSLTIFLGMFVISVVFMGYRNTVNIKNDVNNAYEDILKAQSYLQDVRNVLLTINKDINLFLLDPINEDLIHKIDINTTQSIKSLRAMMSFEHNFHPELVDQIAPAIEKFINLNKEVKNLIEFRLDINKQYPALDINANIMETQQDSVKSGLSILAEEIETGGLEPSSEEIYPLILKSYIIWIEAISQTRIYMANRLASFTTEILDQQGKSLTDIYLIFSNNINTLIELYETEDSFEGTEILASIKTTIEIWHEKFLEMREISESDQWRTDTMIMKTHVFPLVSQITMDLNQIESSLNLEKTKTNDAVKQSDDSFNLLILAIIGLFLLFIFAILTSMEWMIFNPIKQVTLALRSKAFDIDLPNLKTAKTLEVGKLIDAFMQMDEEVSLRQHALEHQAMHDHLTGLPNRFLLNQRIEYQLLSAERQKSSFVLFLMDLDFFKDINDTLGHAAGDDLLIEVSLRIQKLLRKSDTLARLGGDEFSILLPDTDKGKATELANKVIDSLSNPFDIKLEKVNVGISIGIVGYPDDGRNVETLLQYADMAMYTAKRKRIGFAYYEPSQNIYNQTRLNLIHDLPNALEKDLFEIYFQPKVKIKDGKICGAEALLRWQHEKHGFIPPDKIIEAAERSGVIHKLSLSIVKKAVSECSKWHLAGHKLDISVNLSVLDLSNKDLCTKVKDILDEFKLAYHHLTFEITESVMMENLALSLDLLNKLNNLGIGLSIDDFGTGFSSLAYLKRLPVNELKIDKSFIMDISQEESDTKIVSSIINLGHNLGLKIVAEGVETQQVMDRLKLLGCDQIQGYFISKPVNADDFHALLSGYISS